MEEATLTSKSQLTLPKAVRDAMGVGPGDKLRFVPANEGFRLVALKGDITALRGLFKGRRAKSLSIDEINTAIAEMGGRTRR
ncbi:MAG: AbrB/MazE/SpoVT family DNA-binding domain-containing protein [Burkholderiales bacterium]|nr:AbrB/MazE/SpoVT family DNA-binding domain-containing protein [Burkholderiales bacterium]